MEFTKEQISELMCKHAEREHGLHDIFEIMLESMMAAERTEFLHDMRDGNKGNVAQDTQRLYVVRPRRAPACHILPLRPGVPQYQDGDEPVERL